MNVTYITTYWAALAAKNILYSACRSMNGTARGAIMKNADGFWQTRDKMQKFGFVCEKTVYDR